ncbi:MAG: rhodanese-like domain-containing protein [Gallionella sp.]|nr:rhodanese-like domain-containing protein [Gallionella sp.]
MHHWKNKLGLVLATLTILLAGCAQEEPGIDVKAAAELQKKGGLLLDVRQPDEYVEGHAPDSKLVPLARIKSRMAELTPYKDKPVAVICRSGRRSALAVSELREAGFTQVQNVDGGMLAWQKAGLPLVQGEDGQIAEPAK